tara:strand:- start:9164 stop:10774 length:1611 start_codon:yes stop_codon:yes gene_type:complete
MTHSFAEQLEPLKKQAANQILERDILRVSGLLGPRGDKSEAEIAKREILKWVRNRSGGNLPSEAEQLQSFENEYAGRNSECVVLDTGSAIIWALKHEEPDKTTAGRIWKNEIIVADSGAGATHFSARLVVGSHVLDDQFLPTSPGYIQQIIETTSLYSTASPFHADSVFIDDDEAFALFYQHLISEKRVSPIVVNAQVSGESYYALRPDGLSKAIVGLGHAYAISDRYSWQLSERLGKQLAVFDGGVRIYNAGFAVDTDPSDCRLFTKAFLQRHGAKPIAERIIRDQFARDSLKRNRIGREVLTFASVKTAALKIAAQNENDKSPSTDDLVAALTNQIRSLEEEKTENEQWQSTLQEDNEALDKRAKEAEHQQRVSANRIIALEGALKNAEKDLPALTPAPDLVAGLAEWIETNFVGRIALASPAKKGLKKAEFSDSSVIANIIKWLADGIDGRLEGTGESLRDVLVVDGYINSPCGGDEFSFEWHGEKYVADWHIKNSGNTRDPKRCLRIYYFWDDQSQQILIADMPAHRRTSMT